MQAVEVVVVMLLDREMVVREIQVLHFQMLEVVVMELQVQLDLIMDLMHLHPPVVAAVVQNMVLVDPVVPES